MTLTHIYGDVGAGKTLFMTWLAILSQKPIYSNYTINHSRYHELTPEMLMHLSSCIVPLDEAYNWLECRLSGGKAINRYMSYILFQSRKSDIEFLLTDQLIDVIDLRFKQMTNIEVFAERTRTGFRYTCTKKTFYSKSMPQIYTMDYSVAEKVFPYFDTWQKINPIDEGLLFQITQDYTEITSEVEELSRDILQKAEAKGLTAKKITKGVVASYCLGNELPKSMVDLIYNRIKEIDTLG